MRKARAGLGHACLQGKRFAWRLPIARPSPYAEH